MKSSGLIIFSCITAVVEAQVIPNSATAPASASNINLIPSAYSTGMKVNFIRTWDASKPYTLESDVISNDRLTSEVKQVTQYVDGLGRPLQVVSKRFSSSGKDLVVPVIYDGFGREAFRYLPYVAIDSNTGDGKFKRNPFNEQASFYSSSTYNPDLFGEQVFYGKTVFNPSPLSWVDSTFEPGNSWGGNQIGIAVIKQSNVLGDSVRIWDIAITSGGNPTSTAYYSSGRLLKFITKNEHNKQLVEYRDLDGRIILKKVQLDASPSGHHSGWLNTYYIYDDLGRLRYVIPPKAIEARNGNWTFANGVLSELCFKYDYDGRDRLILKKQPGLGEVYFVYDNRDRLVMSQDSCLRGDGKWWYCNYDEFNRQTKSGLWDDNNDRNYHQGQAQNSLSYPNPGSNFLILTEKFYDDYSWVSTSGSGLSSSFINTYSGNSNYFYVDAGSNFPFPKDVSPNYLVDGNITGTKTRILGTSDFLYSVIFYDDQGNPVQIHSTNQNDRMDTLTMQYSFTGHLLRALVCHGGPSGQAYKLLTKSEHDYSGRLTKVSKKFGGSPETVIAEMIYNENGQLAKRKIGQTRNSVNTNTYTANALDSLIYSYNIKGWLRGINKDYARGLNDNSWFGVEMAYDFGFSKTQLNGNVAGIRWRSKGDGEQRAYGFSYDTTSRLLRADFTQYNSSNWNANNGFDFTVKDLSYDVNGNILSMTQKGRKLNGSSVIDSLSYGYISNSNKLSYVTDKTNDVNSMLSDFKEIVNNTSQDYSYDGNGNLTVDNNKTVTSITYNHLNLPVEIKMIGKGKIVYKYDATGLKLSKLTVDSTQTPAQTTTTSYTGAFVYENDTLKFVNTGEGRMRPTLYGNVDTMYYDYFEKDHQGNVRVILTDELKTDAYPEATLETAELANESERYSRLDTGRVSTSSIPIYPSVPDTYKQRLIGTGPKVGASIVLKVMAGDQFNVRVNSFYQITGGIGSPVNPLYDLIPAITNSVGSISQSHNGPTILQLESNNTLPPGISGFLSTQGSYDNTRPKAFLNWILFDEQFNFVEESSDFEQVYESGAYSGFSGLIELPHVHNNLPIVKNGYLYVYVSNESDGTPVYFDNLQVTHIRGPLLEEAHHYPFGLVMQGISSKALWAGNQENKFKMASKELQSREFSDNSGIELTDFGARMYDQQIGRWHVPDALSYQMNRFSPYSYGYNNPIRYSDIGGGKPYDIIGLLQLAFQAHGSAIEILQIINQDPKFVEQSKQFTKEGLWGSNSIDLRFTNESTFEVKNGVRPASRKTAQTTMVALLKNGQLKDLRDVTDKDVPNISRIRVTVGIDDENYGEELVAIISHELNVHSLKFGQFAYDFMSGDKSVKSFRQLKDAYVAAIKEDDPLESEAHRPIGAYSGGFAEMVNSVVSTLKAMPEANKSITDKTEGGTYKYEGGTGLKARYVLNDSFINRVIGFIFAMTQSYNNGTAPNNIPEQVEIKDVLEDEKPKKGF